MGGMGVGGIGMAPRRTQPWGLVPRSLWSPKKLGCARHGGPKGLNWASGGTFHRAPLAPASHFVQF